MASVPKPKPRKTNANVFNKQLIEVLGSEAVEWLKKQGPDNIKSLSVISQFSESHCKNIVYFAELSDPSIKRLKLFLALSDEHFQAGFSIVEIWSKVVWLFKTSGLLIGAIVGVLMLYNQALSAIEKWSGGK